MRAPTVMGRTVEFDPADVTSSATISVYRNGQCFALAAALRDRLNGTVALLVSDGVEVPSEAEAATAWLTWTAGVRHAVMISGETIYDIAGPRTAAEVLAESPGYHLVEVSAAHLAELENIGVKQARTAARITAKALCS